jgi:hypothetical protein
MSLTETLERGAVSVEQTEQKGLNRELAESVLLLTITVLTVAGYVGVFVALLGAAR